jgi:prepilin-type N-terminal cleavage/methylation domain-containing protein
MLIDVPALRSGSDRFAAHPLRGFTMLEVLLALAILALLAAALVGGAARLLDDRPASAEDVFWKAVQEARKIALTSEHEIRLKFDRQKKAFVLIDSMAVPVLGDDGITRQDVPLRELPVPPQAATDLSVDFLAATKGGNVVIIAGMVLESQPIPYVTFYPDGTCTAFRVQLARASGVSTLAIDPWTCAPVLAPPQS